MYFGTFQDNKKQQKARVELIKNTNITLTGIGIWEFAMNANSGGAVTGAMILNNAAIELESPFTFPKISGVDALFTIKFNDVKAHMEPLDAIPMQDITAGHINIS